MLFHVPKSPSVGPPAWKRAPKEVGNRTANTPMSQEQHLTAGGLGWLDSFCIDTGPFSSLCRVMLAVLWHVKNPQEGGF